MCKYLPDAITAHLYLSLVWPIACLPLLGCHGLGVEARPFEEPSAAEVRRLVHEHLVDASGEHGARSADRPGTDTSADSRDTPVPAVAEGVDAPDGIASPNSSKDDAWLIRPVSVEAVKAPLESLLFALADDAGVTLSLRDPLPGTVTLSTTLQPLALVLDQLAAQSPFRWAPQAGKLVVHDGRPYTASYNVEYLNIDRSTHSSVGLATQVGTINADSSGTHSSGANNSQTLVENRAEHRFWASLDTDLLQLIADSGSHPAGGDSGTNATPGFSINRDAGLITLHAGVPVHRRVDAYLAKLNDSVQRQVLIEATVVEVTLSKNHETGVDWRVLAEGNGGLSAVQRLTGSPLVNADTASRLATPGGLISLVQKNRLGDIGVTLNLLEQFGDVRILSRPRIIALNNQSSVLKVVDNRVYFTVNVERQRTEDTDEIITETEIHTVPVGLVMNVTPFIGREGDVMLNVRPTLSRILGFVDDPNPELAAANVRNSVPEIQVREMESMLRVASGDMAIIGGLMQESVDNTEERLPGIGSLPIVRHLFSSQRRRRSQTELLIVLRPTVLPAVTRPVS